MKKYYIIAGVLLTAIAICHAAEDPNYCANHDTAANCCGQCYYANTGTYSCNCVSCSGTQVCNSGCKKAYPTDKLPTGWAECDYPPA